MSVPSLPLKCYNCGADLGENPKVCRACNALQTRFCANCKHEFSRGLSRCPACGTAVNKKRRSARRASAVREWVDGIVEVVRDRRIYLLYVIVGLVVGAIARPILIWLASYSMPVGWVTAREYEPFSFKHFIEPFWAAAKTLGHWVYFAVSSAYHWIADMIIYHPSGFTLGIIGAALGFWLAYRREHKRRYRD